MACPLPQVFKNRFDCSYCSHQGAWLSCLGAEGWTGWPLELPSISPLVNRSLTTHWSHFNRIMLKPILQLCNLFISSISSGICCICKKGCGSCQGRLCFSTGLGFLAVLLSCHPPGQSCSESLSSFCLNILLCCSVASRPFTELLFCLEKWWGFVECLVGESMSWEWIRMSNCSSWLHSNCWFQ